MVEMLRARLRLADEPEPRGQLERIRTLLLESRVESDGALPLVAQMLGVPPEAGYTPLALHP